MCLFERQGEHSHLLIHSPDAPTCSVMGSGQSLEPTLNPDLPLGGRNTGALTTASQGVLAGSPDQEWSQLLTLSALMWG